MTFEQLALYLVLAAILVGSGVAILDERRDR